MQAHADYVAPTPSVASQAAQYSVMDIHSLTKAAKAGQPGTILFSNQISICKDVQKDERQAFAWYKAAADQGLAVAQLNVGRMLADGIGTKKMKHWLASTSKKQLAVVITVPASIWP